MQHTPAVPVDYSRGCTNTTNCARTSFKPVPAHATHLTPTHKQTTATPAAARCSQSMQRSCSNQPGCCTAATGTATKDTSATMRHSFVTSFACLAHTTSPHDAVYPTSTHHFAHTTVVMQSLTHTQSGCKGSCTSRACAARWVGARGCSNSWC